MPLDSDNSSPEYPLPGIKALQPVQSRLVPETLALLTLALSLLVTYGLWRNAQRVAEENLRVEFNFQVKEKTDQIIRRMSTYEQVLRGTKGLLNGSIDIEWERFRSYMDALNLKEHFPGIQAIGVSKVIPENRLKSHIRTVRSEGFSDYRIWPDYDRDFYTSIVRIEPFNQMNRRAFGFDMFTEPVRREAMIEARDTGLAVLSGKVTLVQENAASVQSGFLMYLPIYRSDMQSDTQQQRRASFLGWVYAPFRINDFMSGLTGTDSNRLAVTIYDGEVMSMDSCLFGCTHADHGSAMFKSTHTIIIAEHPWTLDFASTPAFEAELNKETARLIAAGGIITGLLLSVLVWILATGRRRALAMALNMTSELRASHSRIAAEQQRIKIILENALEAFVSIDANGTITDWNIQAERTFGWTAEEAVGKDLAELIIPPEQRAAHHAGLQRFRKTGTGPVINQRIEVTALHRSGRLFPVELAVAAVKSETGYTSNAFIRDLTQRKEAEKREADRQQMLEQTRNALQHAQKMEAVGKLTGGVAHDFNNVLQVISGNVQLLLHGLGANEQQSKRLHNVLDAVDRASKLSSQLLAFARRQPLDPRVINIHSLLRNMEDLIRRAIGAEIEIRTIAAEDLWNVLVDPHRLENVILNLAINARDAMKGQGTLTIEVFNTSLDEKYVHSFPEVRPGRYVVLAMSDTGTGMPAEVLEQVFEPFFTTKPEGEGTGLGLSMAYGFVKQSGGHIRIYSEVGHGTTVKIYLPRADALEEDALPTKLTSPIVGGNERILVVEDDPNVQASVVAMLADLGYEVLKASDGKSALDLIDSGEKFDLLFTDVIMPGPVRSTELVKAAKARIPGLAVLFTSGYTQNAIVHGGRLEPGVNLLSKPYRREQLARKIRELLDGNNQ